MKLDDVQRTMLLNQFMILQKVDPDEHWTHAVEVFRNSFEFHYNEFLVKGAPFPEERSLEVIDILEMFRYLDHAKSEVRFSGFDGNHPVEGRMMGYVSYLWRQRKFEESKHNDIDGGNSHSEMLPTYRRMVQAWKNGREHAKYPLTPEDVTRIEAAELGR